MTEQQSALQGTAAPLDSLPAPSVPILIVDDNAGKRLSIRAALAPLDLTIVEAETGIEALRHLLTQNFAVILLDIRMPIMDGFVTAGLIRTRQRSEMTPIIFISAHSSDESLPGRLAAVGAFDFVAAPFRPAELRAKVSAYVHAFEADLALAG